MPFYAYVLVSDEFYHTTGHTSDPHLEISQPHLGPANLSKSCTMFSVIFFSKISRADSFLASQNLRRLSSKAL
jgi:hypothetical protein